MTLWCKKCEREVGNWHACFFGLNAIRPLKPNPNTRNARKLATYYEYFTSRLFPRGLKNSRIISNGRLSGSLASEGIW